MWARSWTGGVKNSEDGQNVDVQVTFFIPSIYLDIVTAPESGFYRVRMRRLHMVKPETTRNPGNTTAITERKMNELNTTESLS